MIGKPKYKIGNNVKFTLEGREYHGKVYIVDEYGTWDDPSDVSYDIMVIDYGDNHDKECLFKHLTEKLVSLNMKTFGELKSGDYIYYYDHGIIRKQLVEYINFDVTSEDRFTDYYGTEHVSIRHFIELKTPNKTYKISQYIMKYSTDIFYGMRRFACIEAAEYYINNMLKRDNKKIAYAQELLNKYTKLKEKHSKTISEML